MLLDTKSHTWPQSTQLFSNMGLYQKGHVSENMACTEALPNNDSPAAVDKNVFSVTYNETQVLVPGLNS